MKYKLYTDIKYPTATEQVLKGRGIEDVRAWLDADMTSISSWQQLTYMGEAVSTLNLAIQHDQNVAVVVDCDCDGYTSAAVLINYLYAINPQWTKEHLTYYHHRGKEHGLSDMRDKIPDSVNLIICPDSASNDYDEHLYWDNKNVDIIILDHHEASHVSTAQNTITVNNQLCDYPNKEFSGAGIVWQFCQAYNEFLNYEGKIDIDLAALGCCGDMMSFQNIETKAFVMEGFSHISNLFFEEMVSNNEYTLNKYGGVGYKAMAFAVVPFINATVRSGTAEEKDTIFRAMCDMYNQEEVPNTKRGHKGEYWPLYKQAAYLTTSIKRRQAKLETESMSLLEQKIQDNNLLDDSILVCCCEPGEVEPNIRGLAANKLANKYQRPCLVLTKSKTKDDNEYFYRGSGRNYGMSEVQDLKAVEESTGLVEYVQGHNNAHGCSISEKNIQPFVNAINEIYKDVPREATYWVDYVWKMNEATSGGLLELADMAPFWGQDIPASQVAITDIDLRQCQLRLCGSKNDTLRLILPNGVVGVKFRITPEEFEQMTADNTYMTCIASPQRNEWNGQISGEFFIDDYILTQQWIF